MGAQSLSVAVADKRVAGDVAFIDLAATTGELPRFTAGSHIDVHLRPGLTRQYSLWNSPQQADRYRIAVRLDRQGRGGSAMAHDLVPGELLSVSTPRNAFPLEPAPANILIGAGIGITPLLSMASELHMAGRRFILHYIERAEKAAFRDIALGAPWADMFDFHDTSSGRPDLSTMLTDRGDSGRIYVCGPVGFMNDLRRVAAALSIAQDTIREELFMPRPIKAEGEFSVQTSSDGQVHVIPADRSIAEVLNDAGYGIPVSCEQGMCGTCLTNVLSGIPQHGDVVLTEAERASNRFITPCCSRAQSALLVLDL